MPIPGLAASRKQSQQTCPPLWNLHSDGEIHSNKETESQKMISAMKKNKPERGSGGI